MSRRKGLVLDAVFGQRVRELLPNRPESVINDSANSLGLERSPFTVRQLAELKKEGLL